jgi:hypothetical protein
MCHGRSRTRWLHGVPNAPLLSSRVASLHAANGDKVEIQEALEKAWAAVVDSGVPESVQQIAFREALARIAPVTPAAPAPLVNQPNPPAGPRANGGAAAPKQEKPSGEAESALPANELMGKLAHETGISAERWERVIHFSDGKPGISVPTRRLGSSSRTRPAPSRSFSLPRATTRWMRLRFPSTLSATRAIPPSATTKGTSPDTFPTFLDST